MINDRNDDRNEIRRNDNRQRLQELSGSDYKIAENQPDIEDWKILDTTGKKVGKVKDLLFDESAMKVRYIVTNLKKGDWLDDDRDIRESLTDMLRHEGYLVESAGSGNEALSHAFGRWVTQAGCVARMRSRPSSHCLGLFQ